MWYAEVDVCSEELSTDGDASDAGRLDARHVVALELMRLGPAHGRRRGATAARQARGLHAGTQRNTRDAVYSARTRTKYGVRSVHGVRPSAPLAIWSGTERDAAAGSGRRARARTRYTVMTGRRGRARLINQTSPIRTRSTGPPPPYSIFGAGHIS